MDLFGDSIDYEIYFFDKIEKDIIDNAYGYSIDTQYPNPATFEKFEDSFKTTYLREVRSDLYKLIAGRTNQSIHKYLTISFSQIEEYLPVYRIKHLRDRFQNMICYREGLAREINEQEKYIFQSVIDVYEKYYSKLTAVIREIHNDFKTGLLGSTTPQIVNASSIEQKPIKYEDFQNYIKQLEYNYPYCRSVFDFKYTMRDYLDYLKTEILNNLIILGKEDRRPYLNRVKYELENKRQHAYTTQQTIDEWLLKYNVESEPEIKLSKGNSNLYNILTTDPPKFGDEFEKDFNPDTHDIQTDFYNFYYGFYIEEAISFIDKHIIEHSPNRVLPTSDVPELHSKLKTNLSVPQLAYLFKLLMDVKPAILDLKTNKELYLFLEANFTTKGKDESGPTVSKLNNLNSKVDKSVANFWAERLKKMLEMARKV